VSALALIAWLEQNTSTNAVLRRTSETTNVLDLVVRGSGSPSPVAWCGRNVEALDRVIIIDDRFATRVEPEGRTANGEQEPTNIAQAEWSAASRSGTVVSIVDPANPAVLDDGPIVADDALNGLRAIYALDPLHFSVAPTTMEGAPALPTGISPCLAFDTTRRILWGADNNDTLWWRSVVDESVSGTVSLGSGATIVSALVYDPSVDRIIASCGDQSKVVFVNASTKAVTTTVTVATNAWGLALVSSQSRVFVGYDGTVDVDVINTATEAIVGSLSGSSASDGRQFALVYNASSGRYFFFARGFGTYRWYTASTLAFVGSGTGIGGGLPSPDESAATIVVLDDTTANVITPSTGAFTTTALAPATTDGHGVGELGALYHAVGRLYLVTARYLLGFDPATLAWVGNPADVGNHPGSITGLVNTRVAVTFEPGPSSSENAVIYTADLGAIRRFVVTAAQDVVSPFEAFDIVDSAVATQTITAPASGSGGPVAIPTEADAAGQGALIQIRADATLTYYTRLQDNTALALYGAIDAAPQYDVFAKTNYWRGSTFNTNTWRSDNTNRWMSAIYDTTTNHGSLETRWQSADQTAFAFKALATTASYTAYVLTLAVTGLNNGTVLSPGDIISFYPNFSFSAEEGDYWYVRQRTVADSSGSATVPVTGKTNTTIGSPLASGATVYLTTPNFTLDRPNYMALYPTRKGTGTPATAPHWPRYVAAVPVPLVLGDSVAWVVAHIKLACYRFIPADLKMKVYAPYSTTLLGTVSPGDTVGISTGEIRDYWLSQRIDLSAIQFKGMVRMR